MHPLVMGVVNVTPDSFSDGGRWDDTEAAIAHARALHAEGADIIDIGGESTRPGAEPVDPADELDRVVPVIEAIAGEMTVSIDTRHETVAAAALAAGATILNDVSASLEDVAADAGATWIAMHMRGDPTTMQDDPRYDDVVSEVLEALAAAVERGRAAGVPNVWIDPGIGFGKTHDHNWKLLAALPRFVATGVPVVIGTSRKGFLGAVLSRSDGVDVVDHDDRLEASIATATFAMAHGARVVRVHDVRASVHAARVVAGTIETAA